MGQGILNLVKIFVTIVLVPVVYVTATKFHIHLLRYSQATQDMFLTGVLAFLIIFLFFYSFASFHEFGHRMMGGFFSFATPLDQFLAGCIPFFPTVLLPMLFLIKTFFRSDAYTHYFVFLAGLSFAMHFVLVAQDIQGQEVGFFRPTYYFKVSLTVLFNVVVMILLFDLALGKWTLVHFFHTNIPQIKAVYGKLFHVMMFGR